MTEQQQWKCFLTLRTTKTDQEDLPSLPQYRHCPPRGGYAESYRNHYQQGDPRSSLCIWHRQECTRSNSRRSAAAESSTAWNVQSDTCFAHLFPVHSAGKIKPGLGLQRYRKAELAVRTFRAVRRVSMIAWRGLENRYWKRQIKSKQGASGDVAVKS